MDLSFHSECDSITWYFRKSLGRLAFYLIVLSSIIFGNSWGVLCFFYDNVHWTNSVIFVKQMGIFWIVTSQVISVTVAWIFIGWRYFFLFFHQHVQHSLHFRLRNPKNFVLEIESKFRITMIIRNLIWIFDIALLQIWMKRMISKII